MTRVPISPRTRFSVLERDKFRCAYCGKKAAKTELHVDHIHPHSKGGNDTLENLTTACRLCNAGKNSKVIQDPNLLQIDPNRKKKSKHHVFRQGVLTKVSLPEPFRELLEWAFRCYHMDPRLVCLIAIRNHLDALRANPPALHWSNKIPPPTVEMSVLNKDHQKSEP